MATTKFTLCLY